ncbi:MAG: alpha/beta hydrolase [Ornithinimicrobium sp.]
MTQPPGNRDALGATTGEESVRLADGRDLRYVQFGQPDAPEVIYCHGFPSNSVDLRLLEPMLEQYPVRARVVAIDRPGFGRSSFQPGKTFSDWPRDVAEVADRWCGRSAHGPQEISSPPMLVDDA